MASSHLFSWGPPHTISPERPLKPALALSPFFPQNACLSSVRTAGHPKDCQHFLEQGVCR